MSKTKTTKPKAKAKRVIKPLPLGGVAKKPVVREQRPTVKKKCGRCGKSEQHGTFKIKATGQTRVHPWCRKCDRTRRQKARAKAKKARAA